MRDRQFLKYKILVSNMHLHGKNSVEKVRFGLFYWPSRGFLFIKPLSPEPQTLAPDLKIRCLKPNPILTCLAQI